MNTNVNRLELTRGDFGAMYAGQVVQSKRENDAGKDENPS